MADPFKDGSGNFTYGYITDEANVLEDNGLITSSATESLDFGLVADEILYSVQLQGIEINAFAGNISENVTDTIQITGQEALITAESISASGVQNPIIAINGLDLSAEYGNINENVADSVNLSGIDALINAATISANGIQSPSIALNGIDLTAQYGSINEQVVDTVAISGINLNISAQSISASATANPVIRLNGISLQARTGEVSARGADIIPEEYTGGRFSKNEISATAKVIPVRAIAYAGRVTPRGFTVINGGARVLSVETNTQINEATASGQLGIDDESLLLLLVA